MHDSNCIFCRIASGSAPATVVYEDEATIAFLDNRPSSPGHTLVIPRNHARDIFAVSEGDAGAVAKTVRRVARAIDQALAPEGMRIAQLNRAPAGQTVFHYHVHVVPAVDGNKGRIHGRDAVDQGTRQSIANRIKAELPS